MAAHRSGAVSFLRAGSAPGLGAPCPLIPLANAARLVNTFAELLQAADAAETAGTGAPAPAALAR